MTVVCLPDPLSFPPGWLALVPLLVVLMALLPVLVVAACDQLTVLTVCLPVLEVIPFPLPVVGAVLSARLAVDAACAFSSAAGAVGVPSFSAEVCVDHFP